MSISRLNLVYIGITSSMTKREKHPKKEIEEAICYAESRGWRYKDAGNSAHAWG